MLIAAWVLAATACGDTPAEPCGNGSIDRGEACDTAIPIPCDEGRGYAGTRRCTDGCNTIEACETDERCGDGVVNGVEVCDDGADNGQPDHCDTTCLGPTGQSVDAGTVGTCVPFEPIAGKTVCLVDRPQVSLANPPAEPPPATSLAAPLELPPAAGPFGRGPNCPPAHDQGNCAWCVAHASTAALEIMRCERESAERLSEPHLWLLGHGDVADCRRGWWLSSAGWTLRQHRIAPAAVWPFDPNPDVMAATRPSEGVLSGNARHFVAEVAYSRDARQNVAFVKTQLARGIPVLIGAQVYWGMGWLSSDATYPTINCSRAVVSSGITRAGWHAILLIGYDADGVHFRNSWGADWGDEGHGRFTWDCFDNSFLVEPRAFLPPCGDGFLQLDEVCDDGTSNGQPNHCNSTCSGPTPSVCGNTIVEAGEACDDGVLNGRPCRCDAACAGPVPTRCGDGVVCEDEVCDDGTANGGGPCRCNERCDGRMPTTCGDGAACGDELCDDGPGNGGGPCSCNERCDGRMPTTCGDGATCGGEACDDGNTEDCAGACAADCSGPANWCRDGVMRCGEVCERGATGIDPGCDAATPVCDAACSACQEAPIRADVALGVGSFFVCALDAEGVPRCDGNGATSPPSGLRLKTIACGYGACCGLDAAGVPVCWGELSPGGDPVPAGVRFERLAMGGNHACGLDHDGAIHCWGDLPPALAQVPSGSFVAIAGGIGQACAIAKDDNRIVCWGTNTSGEIDAPPGAFRELAVGGTYACALDADGQLACWGGDGYGVVSAAPEGPFAKVFGGVGWHMCALRPDGMAHCWGRNDEGQCDVPAGPFTVLGVATGFSCGLRPDGTRVCWGVGP
jgi:hypothetical protein